MTDLRYAFRSLLRNPSYPIVALVTLALGIGLNTSMFSTVNALLFRGAPFPDADRLVVLSAITRNGTARDFSDQEIREIRPQATGLSSLTTLGHSFFALAEPGHPAERIHALSASREMLDTFRLQPLLGRTFVPAEFEPGKNQVVLLTETFWQARFGSDPNIIGRTLRLDGEPVTVVGVLPARLTYRLAWGNISLWRPLNFSRDQSLHRSYRAFELYGRLQPGATAAAVVTQLAPLAATQEKENPQDYPGLRYRAVPIHEAMTDALTRGISWMLLGLSSFVLLIGCANLANLQLARATSSLREFAIRAALGASRGRLIRQQLTECVLLGLAGGLLGFIVALWVNSLLEQNILIDGAHGFHIPMDARVLGATLAFSVLSGIMFGFVPALFASRADVNVTLKQGTRGSTASRGHHRLRHALIIGEVALALVLLGGAAIMNRGFSNLLQRDPGWDAGRVLTGAITLPETRFDNGPTRIEFYRRLETRLAALPGVEHVALASSLPLFNYTSDQPMFIDGPAGDGQAQNPVASNVMVTPDYFAAMGIRIVEGHTFPADIKADGPHLLLLNESFAHLLWPHESAVGKRLGRSNEGKTDWWEVIGVVNDVEPAVAISNPATRFAVYRPLVEEPWSYINFVVRAENPGSLTDSVRRAAAEIDPDLPAEGLGTVRQFVDRTQHNIVIVGQMLTGFAALGLVLAAVGLYGVISHLVALRTTEFGIRFALGARPQDVMSDVLRRGLRLALTGLAIGLTGAYGLGRFLMSIMPRLAVADPLALAVMAVLLLGVALVACWLPARRAARVDPIAALRAE
jgi:predicted permease